MRSSTSPPQPKLTVLDNVYGADIVLANSTKGFPRYNGQIIIGNTTTNKHELLSYTEAQSDRFIGVQRLNPLSSVEVGNNFADMSGVLKRIMFHSLMVAQDRVITVNLSPIHNIIGSTVVLVLVIIEVFSGNI